MIGGNDVAEYAEVAMAAAVVVVVMGRILNQNDALMREWCGVTAAADDDVVDDQLTDAHFLSEDIFPIVDWHILPISV